MFHTLSSTRRWLFLGALVAELGLAVVIGMLDARVRAYLAGPSLGGVRIFSAPRLLQAGQPLTADSLDRTLSRLGYRRTSDSTTALALGEFRADGQAIEIAQRPPPAPSAEPPRRVRITLRGSRVSELRDLDAGPLDGLELEPEVLAVIGGRGPLLGADAEAAPPACREAVLAAEDRNFFRHPGVDPLAIARALVVDLRAGAARQGGSTLTQQLVKNAFLSPHRTVWRKIEEAVLAFLLNVHASKDEILARYLSSVYLGTDSGLPVHGFAQAALVYLAKPLADLGPAECALLAGIIRSPNSGRHVGDYVFDNAFAPIQ